MAVDQARRRHGPILRRTGEEEEGSGDCMATVAGFGTGAVLDARRWIAEGDLEKWGEWG